MANLVIGHEQIAINHGPGGKCYVRVVGKMKITLGKGQARTYPPNQSTIHSIKPSTVKLGYLTVTHKVCLSPNAQGMVLNAYKISTPSYAVNGVLLRSNKKQAPSSKQNTQNKPSPRQACKTSQIASYNQALNSSNLASPNDMETVQQCECKTAEQIQSLTLWDLNSGLKLIC